MQCILVFKYLHNLVPKYTNQCFTRNRALHEHATRRSNDLHPPKPKRNMGRKTFKYTATIYYISLPAYVKSVPSLNNFKSMLIIFLEFFYLVLMLALVLLLFKVFINVCSDFYIFTIIILYIILLFQGPNGYQPRC